MKKLFLTLFAILILSSASFASEKFSIKVLPEESYLLLLDLPANTVLESNKQLLSSEILTTLYNERNQILIKTKGEGVARLYIAFGDNEYTIIEVDSNKTNPQEVIMPDSKTVKAILKIDVLKDKSEKITPNQTKYEQKHTRSTDSKSSKLEWKPGKQLYEFSEDFPIDLDEPPALRGEPR